MRPFERPATPHVWTPDAVQQVQPFLERQSPQAILRWGFDTLDLNRVRADVDTRNGASARVLEKAGMTVSHQRREADGSLTTVLGWQAPPAARRGRSGAPPASPASRATGRWRRWSACGSRSSPADVWY